MAKDEEVTKAGITTNPDGTRYIPSSVRADGSVRKEIKIKPGYRPPEDIEKYKNRTAEAFRNNGKGGVLGAELVDDSKRNASAATNKNAKRKEARKKAAADKKNDEGDNGGASNGAKQEPVHGATEVDPEAAKQKEVKKLVKKLRQAKELKDKKESGAALLPEQFEKVIKINELIRQLESLGVGPDGESKDGSAEEQETGAP